MLEVLIKAAHKSSKLLLRDYYELENLQHSVRGTLGFVLHSVNKVKETLKKELSNFSDNFKLCFAEDWCKYKSKAIFINPLDGVNNLAHSVPFFASVVLVQGSENNSIACVIDCPAMREVYYAESGHGAWVEKLDNYERKKFRLRVSVRSGLHQSLFVTDQLSQQVLEEQKVLKILRSFGSGAVCGCYVSSGKADLFLSSTIDPITKSAVKLLITESGGFCTMRDNLFIASSAAIKYA